MLLAMLLLGAPAVRAADLSISPAQPSVQAGASLDFTGAGFTPHERVVTWATSPNQAVIGGTYADAEQDGSVAFNFQVPSSATSGRWAMTAYGLISKVPVIVTFEVIGQPPDITPQAAVAPQSGPPGTRFAFAALGYKKKEKVSYWLTAPDGKVFAAYPEDATANTDGRIDLHWTSPANAPTGTWAITMQGLKSNVVRAVPFEIAPSG
jgi:hypothetical protein